jgi:hypothetical protein
VEAEEAGTDSIVEFQWGENDDSGLKGYIEYINWSLRVGLGSIVYIPQTGKIEWKGNKKEDIYAYTYLSKWNNHSGQ